MRNLKAHARRIAAVVCSVGLMSASAASITPAHADPFSAGFTTKATAIPLLLEIFEPSIPIPTEPQLELAFSYTRVLGESGPATSARASAMWPGPAVGEGLKTFGEQLGLPGALTDGGYPVQSNARYPGEPSQASGEPLPGMVQRVNATETKTTAKAGYTGSGDLTGDDADGDSSGGLLDAITSGDLSAFGGIISGATSGSAADPVQTNPLGALSLLIDFDGMTSVSSTTYEGDTVVATATSRIGELRLLAGLVKLTGVNVVTTVTSSVDGGAKTSQKVEVGGMTILGQEFAYGPDGITAAGSTSSVPAIPLLDSEQLMDLLGIKFSMPKPTVTKDGNAGSVAAEALTITLDLTVLHSSMPKLPLDDLFSSLPDLPGQAGLLKGLLLSLDEFAPRFVLHLGQASASAVTIAAPDLGGGDTTTDLPAVGTSTDVPTDSGVVPDLGTLPEIAPETGAPVGDTEPFETTPINPAAAVPGLPPLGSIPMLLMLLGMVLAALVGWYLRWAGATLFGAGAACHHGLKSGVPDLRKARS